jgi:MFS family permease
VIGGVILALFPGPDGWRWVFYVNVPIGLITLVLAARLVPPATGSRPRDTHLDLVGSLLLGGAMLCLLLPVVKAEDGGLTRLWYLYAAAVLLLLVAFARWELRVVRRGRQPLLDPGLAQTSGYVAGSGIGLVYFSGFTGIWLVFALFFQDGLGYSPLHSGMAVTPLALGVAASAVVAGRLVARIGRWLTVCGLSVMALGLIATAITLRNVGGDAAAWSAAGPLLVAGLGGGLVTAPNITLTLESVPVPMAGVAGGALQTAQRIGGAIGTAVLAVIYYQELGTTGHDYSVAVSDAVLVAAAMMLVALLMAVLELLRRRRQRPSRPSPLPRPEHHLHHI